MARRVLITRAASDADDLLDALAARGMVGVSVPLIERTVCRAALEAVSQRTYDWWFLTSPFTVRALAEVGLRPGSASIAVVGPSTARAVREQGWEVQVQPEVATARALVEALGPLRGARLFYPCADLADGEAAAAMGAQDAHVDVVVAYHNRLPTGAIGRISSVWPVDGVALLSGSAGRRLVQAVPLPWPESTVVVCIGPSTAAVLDELGIGDPKVAQPHSVEGVVRALQHAFGDAPVR